VVNHLGMTRSSSKLAAQPEQGKHRPKATDPKMSTADRVRASLLAAPGRGG
jgi:hypothetical protein